MLLVSAGRSRPTRLAPSVPLAAAALLSLATGCQIAQSIRPDDSHDEIMQMPPADRPAPRDEIVLPMDEGSDWVQLLSGEWLRGRIVRIRDRDLDFDSDELGIQSFGIDDLKTVRTAGPVVLVTQSDQTIRGRLTIEGEDAWIEGEQTVRIPRDEILASISAENGSAVEWSGGINAGLVSRSGNTDQTDLSLRANAVRETAQTRWTNTYVGAYSEAQNTRIANNHRFRSLYDIFLTSRFFLTLPALDVFHDEFQNIAVRVTPSASVGYEIVNRPDHSWRVSAGPAYQYTRFDTAPEGEDDEDSSLAATLTSFYTWDISGDVEFGFDYQITAPIPDTDEYNHNFVLRLNVDLVSDLVFNVSFIWDRVNSPVPNGDGTVPLKDDYRTTIGLGWRF